MAVVDSVNDRSDSILSLFLGIKFLLEDRVKKLKLLVTYLSTSHDFHHKVISIIVFEDIVQFNDIRMVHLFQDLNLVI